MRSKMNLYTISVLLVKMPCLPLGAWALAYEWRCLHQSDGLHRKRMRDLPQPKIKWRTWAERSPSVPLLTVTYAYRRTMSAPRRSYFEFIHSSPPCAAKMKHHHCAYPLTVELNPYLAMVVVVAWSPIAPPYLLTERRVFSGV